MLSILITHFNRPVALKQCVKAVQSITWPMPFEIVVSDDGSEPKHIELIKQIKGIRLIMASSNQGLAANINKGIKACRGDYILYCQEDFMLNLKIEAVLLDCCKILNEGKLDMIRFRANYKFKKLIEIHPKVFKIPNFSFQNFYWNTYKYSDHPFLIKCDFYNQFGYYLEHTSGDYGETEYAIRLCSLKAKIGLTQPEYVTPITGCNSVMRSTCNQHVSNVFYKNIKRVGRTVRLHIEWFLYRANRRKLISYKNRRKTIFKSI